MRGAIIVQDNEKDLLIKIQLGQLGYMDTIIETYKEPLYKLCYHLTKNSHDADDLFQDTWSKATRNIDKYDTSKNFKTWLLTIAINIYRDNYRKVKRRLNKVIDFFSNEKKEQEFNKVETTIGKPEHELDLSEEKKMLSKAVNKLDDKYRLPIILFYFKELEQSQIAEVLEIPVGTVKSRLNTARKKLLKEMEALGC